jgi:hypothetical protein
MTTIYRAFEPRTITPLQPVVAQRGYQLKVYAVACQGRTFERGPFEPAIAELSQRLPIPSSDAGRPGVGFLILHQGFTADYAVLAWWDQQNELPIHVLVNDSSGWRSANAHESICVFDLEILWFERNLWIATALAGYPLDRALADYLAKQTERP